MFEQLAGAESQTLINWLFAALGALIGWYVQTMKESIKALQSRDKELTDKVHAIEVLVAGDYVTNEQLEKHMDKFMGKLDAIAAAVSQKQDRPQSITVAQPPGYAGYNPSHGNDRRKPPGAE